VNQRGFEFPAFGNFPLTDTTTEDGLVTAGTFNDVFGIVENYANDRDADLYSVGWNLAFDSHGGWKGFADLSWSRTDRSDRFLQTTVGTGRGRSGASDDIGFSWTDEGPVFSPTLDYSDPNLMVLTDVQGWGWFNGPIDQAGYDNLRKTRDDLKQAHFEIERELDSFLSSVKLGVNYTDRSKKLRAVEAYLIPAGGVDEIAVPSDLLLDPVELDRGIGPILTYDPRDLIDAGVLDVVPAPWGDQKAYKVSEKLWTPYVMGVINAQLGSTELTGNVGVQFVHTDQSSTGLVGASGVSGLILSTKSRKYWEVLPSLNLSFRMPNDFIIRFAASKQHIRPRMPDMANNFNYFTDLALGGIINGSGGNPDLKPYAATGVDLNFARHSPHTLHRIGSLHGLEMRFERLGFSGQQNHALIHRRHRDAAVLHSSVGLERGLHCVFDVGVGALDDFPLRAWDNLQQVLHALHAVDLRRHLLGLGLLAFGRDFAMERHHALDGIDIDAQPAH